MEPLLVIVTLVSLALATGMSIVAWRLLRAEEQRSSARVEELTMLAAEDVEPVTAPVDKSDEVIDDADDRDDADDLLDTLRLPAMRSSRPEVIAPVADVDRLREAPVAANELRLSQWHDEPEIDEAPAEAPPLFSHTVPADAQGRRWMGAIAAGVLMAFGAGTFYALQASSLLRSDAPRVEAAGRVLPNPTPATSAATVAATAPLLNLVALSHATDEPGYFIVHGTLDAKRPLADVAAVVFLFDEQGQQIATGRTPLASLAASAAADTTGTRFTVRVPVSAAVVRFRIGFRDSQGGVVSHQYQATTPAAATAPEAPVAGGTIQRPVLDAATSRSGDGA